jgi:putative ABC transport system substrate-binding protein
MRRREFIAGIVGTAAWPLATQAKLVPRLCFIDFMLEPGTSRSRRFDGFFQGLNDLGYVDGQTIAIDYLSADGSAERFPALVAECVRRKVDVIAVSTTPAAQTAKNATHTIPIVMVALGDPVGTGLVDTLGRPGGNVTGTSTMASDLAAKRLALLKEAVPGMSRVLVLSYLVDPVAPLQVKALQEAARPLGVTLQVHDIRTADDISAAFNAGVRDRAEGLVMTIESIFIAQRAQLSKLAAQYKLPAIYPHSIQVTDAGGLMSYDVDYADLQKRAARYVDRILRGAKPSDLPIQQPTTFTFLINLTTAKELGLTIPASVLATADQLIE